MLKKILVPLGMVLAFAQAGEKVCVPYFERINLPEEYKLSSIRIFKSKMESVGFREIVIPEKSEDRNSDMSLDSNLSWAKANSCQYLLLGSLTRLGETVQFSAKIMESGNKNTRFSKSYKASDPDDLDPIFSQVANAANEPNFVAQQSIYDVSQSDVARLKQKRSNTNYAFGVGYLGFPVQADNTFGLSAAMVWDARKFIGELDFAMFAIGQENGTSLLSMSVNLYKPLSEFENSFYVGGGAGLGVFGQETCQDTEFGYKDCESKSETTLLLQGSGGYIVGRASDFNFRIQSDIKMGLTTIDGTLPFGVGIRAILGFDY